MNTWNTLSFFFSTAIFKCTLSHGFFTFLINVFIAKGLKEEIIVITVQYALLVLPYS